MRSIYPRKWHLCGWIERIPGGARQNDGQETSLGWGACGREISVGTGIAVIWVWAHCDGVPRLEHSQLLQLLALLSLAWHARNESSYYCLTLACMFGAIRGSKS